jgi:hypothetical protein
VDIKKIKIIKIKERKKPTKWMETPIISLIMIKTDVY